MKQRILLTAAGLQNPRVATTFLRLLDKPVRDSRILFIPAAAIFAEALRMLAKCIEELYHVGFSPDQLVVFNCDRSMSLQELSSFEAVYFAGGSPQHLLAKVNQLALGPVLRAFVDDGGFYVGVSAGSILAADLGIVSCRFTGLHCADGSPNGLINLTARPDIRLTDNQALLVDEGGSSIIE